MPLFVQALLPAAGGDRGPTDQVLEGSKRPALGAYDHAPHQQPPSEELGHHEPPL